MKPNKQKNVFDSILLVTVFASIMGTFPTNTIVKNGIRRAKSSTFLKKWLPLFYMTFYTICLIAANIGEDILTSKKQYNFNKIAYLLYVAKVVAEILTTYVQYGLTLYATPYILHALEVTRQSDNLLAKTGYKFRYIAGFVINLVVITSGMYFIVFNISLEVWNSPRENMGTYTIFEIVVTCWPQFLIHMVESQFILMNMLLFTRFFAINLIMETLYKNNAAEDFLKEPPNFLNKVYNFVKNPEVSDEYALYCTMKAHYALYRITVVTNNVFGLIMTFSALIQFTTIAFAICFCYYKLETKPIASIVWLLWAVLRLYELIRKAYVVHLIQGEANKSIYYVNKLLMLRWKDKMTYRLNMFALQLGHCRVRYTACGLFDIDGTLVFTIIAAATMYIIVTYQFQQGLMKSCEMNTNLTDTTLTS